MELKLHANATTTPKVRSSIQRSKKPVAELAAALGVVETTIRRWRRRTTVDDRSHTPKTLQISLSPMEETLVCELRTPAIAARRRHRGDAALPQSQTLPQRHPPLPQAPRPEPAA